MRICFIIISAVFLFQTACDAPGKSDNIVFIFKDKIVTVPKFREQYEMWLNQKSVENSENAKKIFLYNWLYREILYDTGLREGVEYFPEVEEKLRKYKKKLVIEHMKKKIHSEIYSLTDRKIREYYMENRDKFVRKKLYRLSAVRVRDRDDAYRIKKQLVDRRNELRMFSARFSDDIELAENNGDWGLFSPDIMDGAWKNDVMNARLGDLLGPFYDSDGYYTIVEISGYAYDRPLSFKRAYPLIIDHMIDDRGRDKIEKFKDNIVKKYGVKINLDNLNWEQP
ncbi:MAG: peptidyl-prolyl cis-trans isomerase [bacterium]